MDALLLASASPSAQADLARPLAGAPVLVRQLEMLAACGVTRVVANRVASSPLPRSLHAEALAATGVKVVWIPSSGPLTALQLAQRAALADTAVLIVPHGVVGNIELRATLAQAAAGEEPVQIEGTPFEVRRPSDARSARAVAAPAGWWRTVEGEGAAHALSEQVLAGHVKGIEVRGSEISPGVWACRGAVVQTGAVVEAPAYLGPGVFVAGGAQVGPGAVLGESVVVERGARVAHARVENGLVVGQGVVIEGALLSEGGNVEPHVGDAVALDDELLVGHRRSRRLLARAAAVAACAAVAPVALTMGGKAATALHRLARVAAGTGAWVGVRDDQDGVVIDIASALVPPRAEAAERAAARSLYRAKKSAALDAKLLLDRLTGAARAQ
ncbi:MAG TPA: hypothetical protein VGI39_41540 [Polyangiaceae bacterium]|jgi:NDP-sugar pyrophosphorylase family protein